MVEPTIMCAVCGRPVERVSWHREDHSMFGTCIEVWCHGAKDRMFLSDQFLVDLGVPLNMAIVGAVAFQQKPQLSY